MGLKSCKDLKHGISVFLRNTFVSTCAFEKYIWSVSLQVLLIPPFHGFLNCILFEVFCFVNVKIFPRDYVACHRGLLACPFLPLSLPFLFLSFLFFLSFFFAILSNYFATTIQQVPLYVFCNVELTLLAFSNLLQLDNFSVTTLNFFF